MTIMINNKHNDSNDNKHNNSNDNDNNNNDNNCYCSRKLIRSRVIDLRQATAKTTAASKKDKIISYTLS